MSSRAKKILSLLVPDASVNDQCTNNQSVIVSNRCEQPNLEISGKTPYCVNTKGKNPEISELVDAETSVGSSSSEEDPFADNSDCDPNYVPSEISDTSEAHKDGLDEISSSESDDGPTECDEERDVNNGGAEWTPITDNDSTRVVEHTLDHAINIDFDNCKDIVDFFSLFITENVINLLVTETNRYAEQHLNNEQRKRKSKQKCWVSVTQQEMKNFLSIIICTGLVNLPSLQQYWSKNQLYHNNFISSVMTRDRFLLILKYLHFNNNEELELATDKLYRIRPLLDMLNSRFETILTPGRNVVIDESMVPWRGRLGMRQYIKNKRHKYGVKLYKVCTTDGYTYRIRIYCGKEDCIASKGHSHNVVMKVMDGLLDAGRTLYADNFYSSVQLAEELLQRQTFYCGTLRSNRRGLPKDFIQKKLKPNDVIGVCNSHGIKIIKWQDKRSVLMITNKPEHSTSLQSTGRKNRKQQDICKPLCIIDYNKSKKGVDYSDQMSSYYTSLRKSIKWYKKVAFELIFGAAIVNSWIVYNTINSDKKLTLLTFREKLAFQLAKKVEPEVTASTSKKLHILSRDEGGGTRKRRNCTECYKKLRETMSSKEADKKVTKVTTYCEVCEKKPALCLPCFNYKHNKLQ